ncbi:MAG: hypothetical protein L6V93_21475 [Clostridiales bacterium]|nr:MAG: hypothetical protein L6V93_21475 [Clostridiales bacterium]
MPQKRAVIPTTTQLINPPKTNTGIILAKLRFSKSKKVVLEKPAKRAMPTVSTTQITDRMTSNIICEKKDLFFKRIASLYDIF